MTLTLFHSPNACSEGILLLLRAIGAPHDVHIVNVRNKEQHLPEFRAVNPKGKVPALRLEDGSVLTEFTAIAFWIGRTFPDANLLGSGIDGEVRGLELLDFIVASVHMRGFTFLKMPQKFLADADGQAALRAHGREQIDAGLSLLSETLGDQDFLLGDFGIADAGAYYVLRWAAQEEVTLKPNLQALLARLDGMMARD